MLRAVWFAGERRLLLVAHHLVVDGVSWRILAEDLTALLAGGEPAPVATSFRTWATSLRTLDRTAELPFWREQLAGPVRPLGTPTATTRPRTPSRCPPRSPNGC